MYEAGLVSISFRKNSPQEIIEAVAAAGLTCIEWGSDVHCPPDKEETLKEVAELQAKAGIYCCSYGTYFTVGRNPVEDIYKYIKAAKILGADILRIWAGNKSPCNCTDEYKEQILEQCRQLAKIAEEEGVTLCCECHGGTLTEEPCCSLELIQRVNSPAFKIYWQPNQFKTEEYNREYATELSPYITHLHVFNWNKGSRLPLEQAIEQWERYIDAVEFSQPKNMNRKLLLEFMPDDQLSTLDREAQALHRIINSRAEAIFLCNSIPNLNYVYGKELIQTMEQTLGCRLVNYTKTQILEEYENNPQRFAKVKYAFSTWGCPAFTEEEITNIFPALECVFYGAGSVQGFARPFLKKGVKVFSAWAANAVPVAEYTVAQVILANKGFLRNSFYMSKGDNKTARAYSGAAKYKGNYGEAVGIVGAGMIGKLVIKMLSEYNLKVYLCDPFCTEEQAREYGAEKCTLDEIFERCTVISNHVANNPQTVKMFKYEHFSKMRPYSCFINTGRGAQVDEDALVEVLIQRPDITAILDVTQPEPPEEGHPFYTLDNCFLSSHIAGSSGDEVHRMAEYMWEEYLKYVNNQPCKYEVSMKMLETMA